MRRALLAVVMLGLMFGGAAHAADRRIALVVGNGDYLTAPRLDNPVRDARLIAATLKDLGFTLIGNGALENQDRVSLERAIREFGRTIGPGTIALFYYSGHGVQMRGGNYLVPVSANLSSASDVDFELVDVDIVVRQMDAAHSSLNLIVLDACRNNPFGGRGLRDGSAGLAEMRAPRATLISYATQPGGVAQDGDPGGDSPYTIALSKSLRTPGIDVFKAFNMVGVDVSRATNGKQTPWVAASPIEGDFFLAPVAELSPPVAAARPLVVPGVTPGVAALPPDHESLFWQSVQGTNRPEELEAYLRRYPDGTFADLARSRLSMLQGNRPAQPSAPAASLPPAAFQPANPPPEQTAALSVPPVVLPPPRIVPPPPGTKPPPLAEDPAPRGGPPRGDPTPRPRPVSLPPPSRPAPPAAPPAAAPAPVVGFSATAADGRGRRFQSNRAGSEGGAVSEALRLCHGGGDAGSCRIISMAHAPGGR